MLMKGVSIEIMMRTMGRVSIIMMILMIKLNMLLEMITVAMMSTKMLLVMIRMTMMLMNMIMTTMLVFTRRRRRHNLFLNGFIYTYIAVAVQQGPSGRWADAAAACLLRLMQPLQREKHCKRHGACGI